MQFEAAFEGIGAGPVIAGAAALAIVMGVVAGQSIDTTPLQRGETFDQLVPDPRPISPDRWTDAGANMPDHYPQETRNGRVEVWELRSYILRRERQPTFGYSDGDAKLAAADEALPETEVAPPGERPELNVKLVPGRLEQVALPIGDEAVLESASAHIARADAISAELRRGAVAWELGAP